MYCHILRVRAIPTLESTDSVIADRYSNMWYQIWQYVVADMTICCSKCNLSWETVSSGSENSR